MWHATTLPVQEEWWELNFVMDCFCVIIADVGHDGTSNQPYIILIFSALYGWND